MSTPIQYHTFQNPTNLSKSQLWLIATSAMLTQLNKEYHDTLLPHHIYSTPKLLGSSKQCLLRDWEISNLAELSDTIKYLNEEKTFELVERNWEHLSETEFNRTQQFGDDLLEYRTVLDMTHNYQFNLSASDAAWHYGRCAWIIRHAFYNVYITESEAWSLLEENGKRIKETFDSWESFGRSYLIGAQYWQRKSYQVTNIKKYIDNITYLLTNQHSPWIQVHWNDYA